MLNEIVDIGGGDDSPRLMDGDCAPSSGSDSSINAGLMRMAKAKQRRKEVVDE